jgi:hypothetical protein
MAGGEGPGAGDGDGDGIAREQLGRGELDGEGGPGLASGVEASRLGLDGEGGGGEGLAGAIGAAGFDLVGAFFCGGERAGGVVAAEAGAQGAGSGEREFALAVGWAPLDLDLDVLGGDAGAVGGEGAEGDGEGLAGDGAPGQGEGEVVGGGVDEQGEIGADRLERGVAEEEADLAALGGLVLVKRWVYLEVEGAAGGAWDVGARADDAGRGLVWGADGPARIEARGAITGDSAGGAGVDVVDGDGGAEVIGGVDVDLGALAGDQLGAAEVGVDLELRGAEVLELDAALGDGAPELGAGGEAAEAGRLRGS